MISHDVDRDRILSHCLSLIEAKAAVKKYSDELGEMQELLSSLVPSPELRMFLDSSDVFLRLFRDLMVEVTFGAAPDRNVFGFSESEALQKCKELKAALSDQVNLDIHPSPSKITLVFRLRP